MSEENKEEISTTIVTTTTMTTTTTTETKVINNEITDSKNEGEKAKSELDFETDNIKTLRCKVIDKIVKITLKDERVIYGKFSCLDNFKNIILHDSIEEIPDKYIAKINYKLPHWINSQIRIQNYLEINKDIAPDEEALKSLSEEFRKNKFYTGQVLIPASAMQKIEIQKV